MKKSEYREERKRKRVQEARRSNIGLAKWFDISPQYLSVYLVPSSYLYLSLHPSGDVHLRRKNLSWADYHSMRR